MCESIVDGGGDNGLGEGEEATGTDQRFEFPLD